MVSKYSCVITQERFANLLNMPKFVNKLHKNYHINPLDKAMVLIEKNGKFFFDDYVWGLHPSKSRKKENLGNLYNVRIEQLPASPSFRHAFRFNRCLVPADSFYFVEKVNGKKVPYRVHMRDSSAVFFAGLYETWSDGKEIQNTFSIITGNSPEVDGVFGTRVPFIFHSLKEGMHWVQCQNIKESISSLSFPKKEKMKVYRITQDALDPTFNQLEMHEEYHKELTLFDI